MGGGGGEAYNHCSDFLFLLVVELGVGVGDGGL